MMNTSTANTGPVRCRTANRNVLQGYAPVCVTPGNGLELTSLNSTPCVDTISISTLAPNSFKPDKNVWKYVGGGHWCLRDEYRSELAIRPLYIEHKRMRRIVVQFEVGRLFLNRASYTMEDFDFNILCANLANELEALGLLTPLFPLDWVVTKVDFFRDYLADTTTAELLASYLKAIPRTDTRVRVVSDEEVFKAFKPWVIRVYSEGTGFCLYLDVKDGMTVLRSEVRWRQSQKISRWLKHLKPGMHAADLRRFDVFMHHTKWWDHGYNLGLRRLRIPENLPVVAGATDRTRKCVDRYPGIAHRKKPSYRKMLKHGFGGHTNISTRDARAMLKKLENILGIVPAFGIKEGPDVSFNFLYT